MAHWQFHYPKRITFGPGDYEVRGLGGSETALHLLTRQLARRGHDVEVFNAVWDPGNHEGVHWRGAWELPNAEAPDVAVAVRFDEAIRDIEAKHHLFWMLDDRTDGPRAFAEQHPGAPIVLASNAMHARVSAASVKAPITQIPLPIETDRYQRDLPRERACLYSSMPNRGLDALLSFWPRIREQVPDAELWITSGWRLWGYTRSEASDRWHRTIGDPHDLPDGVRLLTHSDSLPKGDLIDVQQRAWLSLYPCRFPEMFCYSAAESATAATPVITSDLEALAERVAHNQTGVLVPGDIDEPVTQDQFVTATVDLLTNPDRRTQLGTAAQQVAAAYDLDTVADQWEKLIK